MNPETPRLELIVSVAQYRSNRIDEQLHATLKAVARSSYETLNLVDWIHPDWIVSLVTEGHVKTMTRSMVFPAPAGTVMIHPPGIPFGELADGPGTHDWIQFQLRTAQHVDLLRLYPVGAVVILDGDSKFTKIMHELRAVWNSSDSPLRSLRCTSLLTTLLLDLIDTWERQGATPRPPDMMDGADRLTQILDYMARNIEQKHTLESLAHRLHLHPNYFLRTFRREYGVTPIHMLQILRVQRAQTLLVSGDQTLSSVAEKSGFSDVSYFCRVFKRITTCTPTEYRQRTIAASNPYLPS